MEKYFAYQRFPSLEEYVVIGQDLESPHVRIFSRSQGWEPGETHIAGEFILQSVDLRLSVSEIYADKEPEDQRIRLAVA